MSKHALHVFQSKKNFWKTPIFCSKILIYQNKTIGITSFLHYYGENNVHKLKINAIVKQHLKIVYCSKCGIYYAFMAQIQLKQTIMRFVTDWLQKYIPLLWKLRRFPKSNIWLNWPSSRVNPCHKSHEIHNLGRGLHEHHNHTFSLSQIYIWVEKILRLNTFHGMRALAPLQCLTPDPGILRFIFCKRVSGTSLSFI